MKKLLILVQNKELYYRPKGGKAGHNFGTTLSPEVSIQIIGLNQSKNIIRNFTYEFPVLPRASVEARVSFLVIDH